VQGNRIGTDAAGTAPLRNGGNGVALRLSTGNAVGPGNVIAFNGGDGVLVDTGTGNAIRGNSIFGHARLGIELANGGNRAQASPFLTAAASGGGITIITGLLTSAPNTTFVLEFFANTTCDASGSGEGERFLGFATVLSDFFGTASFTFTVAIGVPPGQFITATATNPLNDTSPFSLCVAVAGAGSAGAAGGWQAEGAAAALLPGERLGPLAPTTDLGLGAVSAGARVPLPAGVDAFFGAVGSWDRVTALGAAARPAAPAAPRFAGEMLLGLERDLFNGL
jgi:hypothetical protein